MTRVRSPLFDPKQVTKEPLTTNTIGTFKWEEETTKGFHDGRLYRSNPLESKYRGKGNEKSCFGTGLFRKIRSVIGNDTWVTRLVHSVKRVTPLWGVTSFNTNDRENLRTSGSAGVARGEQDRGQNRGDETRREGLSKVGPQIQQRCKVIFNNENLLKVFFFYLYDCRTVPHWNTLNPTETHFLSKSTTDGTFLRRKESRLCPGSVLRTTD